MFSANSVIPGVQVNTSSFVGGLCFKQTVSQKKLAPLSRGRVSANIKSGRYRYVQLVPHVAAESIVPVVSAPETTVSSESHI